MPELFEDDGPSIRLTADELCALAEAREKLNKPVSRGVVVVMLALAAWLLYNAVRLDQLWIRIGQAWTLGVIVYLFGPALRPRRRDGISEPCAQFLVGQHEERQRGYREFRHRLLLFIPGIAASCWGGGPEAAAKARGLDPASWLYHFLAGPGPFVVAVATLGLVWFAFGKAAEKAGRDRDEVTGLMAHSR